ALAHGVVVLLHLGQVAQQRLLHGLGRVVALDDVVEGRHQAVFALLEFLDVGVVAVVLGHLGAKRRIKLVQAAAQAAVGGGFSRLGADFARHAAHQSLLGLGHVVEQRAQLGILHGLGGVGI